MSDYDNDIINMQDIKFDTGNINILQEPQPPDTLTFNCDKYRVERRQAEIIYNEPLFIEQFHTLIFNINGERIVFERK